MYPAIYWITCWNEIDECIEDISGCTFANSFADAMEKIESYYGDTICSVKVELMEECNILEFKNYEEADRIVKD